MKMSTPSTGQQSIGLSTLENAAIGRHRNAGQTNTQGRVAPRRKEPLRKTKNSRRIDLFSLRCTFLLCAPIRRVKNTGRHGNGVIPTLHVTNMPANEYVKEMRDARFEDCT
jgi:hypothetical protein